MEAKLIGLISGLLIMGYFVGGLFFFRFWKSSSDRLFLYFGLAFWLLAVQRAVLMAFDASASASEPTMVPYVIRLAAFVTILLAILDKNRRPAGQARS